MHSHPRPSPRTASAANNLQTNPTRTNNQRDPTSERSSPYSDTASYTERGPDDGDDEMVTRAEHMSEMEQRNYQKVNQVIQVRTTITNPKEHQVLTTALELLHQSSTHHRLLQGHATSELHQDWGSQTKQMGTSSYLHRDQSGANNQNSSMLYSMTPTFCKTT